MRAALSVEHYISQRQRLVVSAIAGVRRRHGGTEHQYLQLLGASDRHQAPVPYLQ